MTIISPTREALRPLRGALASQPTAPRNWPVFAVAAGVGLLLAFVIDRRLGITHGDSLSRTVNATLVLFSRDPHLAAVGFVWPPLPTLLRMPLLLISRPLGTAEFTGPLTSVLFGAGVVTLLNVMLRGLGFGAPTRLLWILAAMLNPLILLQYANGTAESAFTFFMLLVLMWGLRRRQMPSGSLVAMGLAAALAFLVRYEAVALAAMVVVALTWIEFIERRGAARETTERLLARLIVFGAPVGFVVLIWVGANWTIVGDPLFFFRGAYSLQAAPDIARNATGHALAYAYGSLTGALWFVVRSGVVLSIAYCLGMLVCVWRALVRRDADSVLLCVVCASIPAMLAYQAYIGSIPSYLRYWVYLPVLAVPLCAHILRSAPGDRSRRGAQLARAIVPVLFVASSVSTGWAMMSPNSAFDERTFIFRVTGRTAEATALQATATSVGAFPDWAEAEAVARDLDARPGLRMLDIDRAGPVVLLMHRLDQLVANSDQDFAEFVANPVERGVTWIPAVRPRRPQRGLVEPRPDLLIASTALRGGRLAGA